MKLICVILLFLCVWLSFYRTIRADTIMDENEPALDFQLQVMGQYTGMNLRNSSKTIRNGIGGSLEFLLGNKDSKNWFRRHIMFFISLTDFWIYKYNGIKGQNYFMGDGGISVYFLDKNEPTNKWLPSFEAYLGVGTIGFGPGGRFSLQYRLNKHFGIVGKAGGDTNVVLPESSSNPQPRARYYVNLGGSISF